MFSKNVIEKSLEKYRNREQMKNKNNFQIAYLKSPAKIELRLPKKRLYIFEKMKKIANKIGTLIQIVITKYCKVHRIFN